MACLSCASHVPFHVYAPTLTNTHTHMAPTGPFITDLRLVKTSWLSEPTQPYMEALRKAGFSVVFRPNKVMGGV